MDAKKRERIDSQVMTALNRGETSRKRISQTTTPLFESRLQLLVIPIFAVCRTVVARCEQRPPAIAQGIGQAVVADELAQRIQLIRLASVHGIDEVLQGRIAKCLPVVAHHLPKAP